MIVEESIVSELKESLLCANGSADVRSFPGTKSRSYIFISPYSVQMQENADQNNFEYGHFSRSESLKLKNLIMKQQVNSQVFIFI